MIINYKSYGCRRSDLCGRGFPDHPHHIFLLLQCLHLCYLPQSTPSLTEDPTYFLIYAPIYFVIIVLLLVSYFRAVFTSPGYADPLDVRLPHSEHQIHARTDLSLQAECIKAEVKKGVAQKKSISLRVCILSFSNNQIAELKETVYCDKCEAVKLPRVHHCKICGKCILRMDHHCPWVGNCIGIYNHKYFMLFLLYATVPIQRSRLD